MGNVPEIQAIVISRQRGRAYDELVDADMPDLQEFYTEACKSLNDTNVVELVKSKCRLTTVDISHSPLVTFEAVRAICKVLKSDVAGDRPVSERTSPKIYEK